MDTWDQIGKKDDVHFGDCGATGFKFVANKLVRKEGSDCCGELGVVCETKGNDGMMPERS